MKNLFLSFALLVSGALFGSVRLDTEFTIGEESRKETFVITEAEAATYIYRGNLKVQVSAVEQDDKALLNVTVLHKNEAEEFVALGSEQKAATWDQEIMVTCPVDKAGAVCSLRMTAHKE
jgi:hypothetical protein